MSSFWEFVAMKIERIEERQKLAALYAQRDAVIDEEQAALAPIHARLAEAQDRGRTGIYRCGRPHIRGLICYE